MQIFHIQGIFILQIKKHESFILTFSCAATRSTHLELVVATESLESLLLALRRFVLRERFTLDHRLKVYFK